MKTGFLVAAVVLALAVAWTAPLWMQVDQAIPYTLFPKKGLETIHLFPGDHLQLYYRLWLFTDSLRRGSPFVPEAYEFNDQMGRRPVSSQFVPLSLVYALLAFFGHTAAYNLLLLLTFPLGGLFTYLLLRDYGAGFWGGLAAGLVAAFMPYRVGQLAGGHPNAFVYFVVPLILWLVERYLRTGLTRYAWLAGAAVFSQFFMELHAAFFTFLLLVVYLPIRWLLPVERWLGPREKGLSNEAATPEEEKHGADRSFSLAPWAAAVSAAAFASFRLLASPAPPGTGVVIASALGWGAGMMYLWRLLCAILGRVFQSGTREAAARIAPAFLPFLVLPLSGVKLFGPVPMAGSAAMALALAGMLVLLGRSIRAWAKTIPLLLDPGGVLRGRAAGMLPLVLGTAGGVSWILFLKGSVFSGTGVERGRTAAEAILYTPGLEDAFRRVNHSVEFYLYPGLVCLLIIAAGLLPRRGGRRDDGWILFLFGALGACFYLYCFGQTGNLIFPLQAFLRHLPLMGYGRVSSRAMIVFTPALAVLVGVCLSRLVERGRSGLPATALGLLAMVGILTDFSPAASFGLTRLPQRNLAYEEPGRLGGKGKVLEIPIWPGDSAWSSVYQYWVTRYGHRMVNGYSPVVPVEYLESVFRPLAGVNLGAFGEAEAALLGSIGVDRLILHQEAFPPQVSYFPSRLSLRHLMASPYLQLRRWDGSLWLFDVLEAPRRPAPARGLVTSPVGIILRGESAVMNPCRVAAGGGAKAAVGDDPDHPVVSGPDRFLPAGRFRVTARMGNTGEGLGSALLRVRDRAGATLGEMQWWWNLAPGTLRDFSLPFEVETPRRVTFEVLPKEKSSVAVSYLYLVHDDQEDPPAEIEFEDLAHYGRMAEDPVASGGMVVALERGLDPPVSFNAGPRRRVPAGSWKITIEYRTGAGDNDPGAILVREVDGPVLGELKLRRKPGGGWARASAVIRTDHESFLALEVRYTRGCDLYLDKMGLEAS